MCQVIWDVEYKGHQSHRDGPIEGGEIMRMMGRGVMVVG